MTISPERYRKITIAALAALAAIIVTGASVRLTNTSDWTDFELIVTAPTNAAFLTQWIFKGGDTGTLDVDNVILDTTTAPPPNPTNLLDNPGFEDNLDNWDSFRRHGSSRSVARRENHPQ